MVDMIRGAELICIFVAILIMGANSALIKYKNKRTRYFIGVVGFNLLGILADYISYSLPFDCCMVVYALANAIAYSTEYITVGYYLHFVAALSEEQNNNLDSTLMKVVFPITGVMSVLMFSLSFVSDCWTNNPWGIDEEFMLNTYPLFEVAVVLLLVYGIFKNRAYISLNYWIMSWTVIGGLLLNAITNLIIEGVDFSFVYASMSILVIHMYLQMDEARRREIVLEKLSYNDGLTGIYNRNAYAVHLNQIKKRKYYKNLWYIAIDLDGLKAVNDHYGHKYGDQLICGASRVLAECAHGKGRVYRMGGDEFVMILHGGNAEIENLLQNIRTSMSAFRAEHIDGIAYSIGVVSSAEMEEVSISAMEKLADARMYEDKKKHHGAR